MHTILSICFTAVAATVGLAAWQIERLPDARLNFLACPVVRDTSTLPCWLAEYEGELYFLGSQGSTASVFYPPQLLHEVLVEATVGAGPRICGGIPLQSVEVSVMPEINRACNTILPAEPQYVAPPSPLAPNPTFQDTTREFSVAYDFESDYLTLHTTRVILEAARIAKLVRPKRIHVVARRGATLLSNGRRLVERDGLAELRATNVRDHLTRLGPSADIIRASWRSEPEVLRAGQTIAPRHLTITLDDSR